MKTLIAGGVYLAAMSALVYKVHQKEQANPPFYCVYPDGTEASYA